MKVSVVSTVAVATAILLGVSTPQANGQVYFDQSFLGADLLSPPPPISVVFPGSRQPVLLGTSIFFGSGIGDHEFLLRVRLAPPMSVLPPTPYSAPVLTIHEWHTRVMNPPACVGCPEDSDTTFCISDGAELRGFMVADCPIAPAVPGSGWTTTGTDGVTAGLGASLETPRNIFMMVGFPPIGAVIESTSRMTLKATATTIWGAFESGAGSLEEAPVDPQSGLDFVLMAGQYWEHYLIDQIHIRLAITCLACGDCNLGGGAPDVLDSLTAAQIGVALVTPTGEQLLCCDVNGSGGIDVLDALLIAQVAVSLPVALTCP